MSTTHASTVLVSVVVPTCRRPDLLERCLAALTVQYFPYGHYEIIVCDDACDDEAHRQIQRWQQTLRDGPTLRYLAVATTQGPAGARNMGWRRAQGEIIAFTDDDTIPAPDWLAQGIRAMTSDVAAVTGITEMPLPTPPTDYERDAACMTHAAFITANCFVRRTALQDVGGFDTRYTMAWREDSDLHFALLDRGHAVRPAPLARVLHPVRSFAFAAGLGMQKKVMFDMLLRRKYPSLDREHVRAHLPGFYLCITAAFVATLVLLALGAYRAAGLMAAVWLLLSTAFFVRRLRGTRRSMRDIADLMITSVCIPWLSILWRLVGLVRFQRVFA